jgi:hypothetical protein
VKHFIPYLLGSLLINPLLSELQADLYSLRAKIGPSILLISVTRFRFHSRAQDARGKSQGKRILAAPAEPARKPGQVIDLMQALKQSLGAAPAEKKGAKKASRATATKKRKKAS